MRDARCSLSRPRARAAALAVGAALLFLAGPTQAKLPEIDAVYYGSLAHNGGPLVPTAPGEIVVVARQNGVTLAQAAVTPGQSRYVLKVPRDDGQEPRLPGTARGLERVRVFVRNTLLNQEQEATESSSGGGFLVSNSRSAVTLADLSVPMSIGGASEMTIWLTAMGAPLASPHTQDSDGDGLSDAEEFASLTDPTKAGERFQIFEIAKQGSVNFIRFGPIRANRQYVVWSSPELVGQPWTRVGTLSPGYDAADFWFGHTGAASAQLFYRLEVASP